MKKYYLLFSCFSLMCALNLIARQLSVLFVIDKFPYQMRQYIDNQVVGLIDAGVDVHILASRGSLYEDYALAKEYNFKNITFYGQLPTDKRSYDIIYCQFLNLGLEMFNMKKRGEISGAVIACVRGGSEIQRIKEKPEKYEQFLAEVDMIFPVCEVFKNHLIALGCSGEKVVVHHSAIDVSKFQYKERSLKHDVPKIVTVGRLRNGKGQEFLIEAIKNLKNKYPSIVCDIYGDGNLYNHLDKLIKMNNLANNVCLKGYYNHDGLNELLGKYDIFVLASYSRGLKTEGIPNVLMEAMATGLPVIGTYHSGIPELIENNISGFLVNERDPWALTKKIDYVIAHRELWKPLGKAARKKVLEEHHKEKQNQRLLKIFNMLINKDIL